VTQPERSRSYYVYHAWRAWATGLDQSGESLQIALPFNRPLAAFYRLHPTRPVRPRMEVTPADGTAEQVLAKSGGGWLIVPAGQFMGNEGRISGRTWLYEGIPRARSAWRRITGCRQRRGRSRWSIETKFAGSRIE
jgi:hypothetical protein